MNPIMAARRLLAHIRHRLAVRWADERGCVLADRAALARARGMADAAWTYTLRSGHLRRVYHAGVTLRNYHASIMDDLDNAA